MYLLDARAVYGMLAYVVFISRSFINARYTNMQSVIHRSKNVEM